MAKQPGPGDNRSARYRLETLAVHAAQAPDPTTGAVMPAIQLSTTFAQDGPARHRGYEYARTDNPTRRTLEQCLAALEGARFGVSFGSGCAAATALLQTLRPGDHIVACDDVYGGTYRILERLFVPLGIRVSWVDMTAVDRVAGVISKETKLLWVETPTNPLLKLVDLERLAQVAQASSVPLVVDNTFATPVLQRPLELGARAVVHSTTKYLNGHADVVGGAILTDDEALYEQLRFIQNAAGAIPSPFDCYLVLRGLKTLPLRVRRQAETAAALARYLERHPRVARVTYPGLLSHPQHALATRQMALPGGMLSFEVDGGFDVVQSLCSKLELVVCAESLGGVESLIEHPASMTHAAVPPEVRRELGIGDGLLRFSAGLEAFEDLRDDLARALG